MTPHPTPRRLLLPLLLALGLLAGLTSAPASGDAPQVCQAATYYIGNVRSRKFHLPTCRTLPAPANRVEFSSRQEAISRGYSPCGNCNREEDAKEVW